MSYICRNDDDVSLSVFKRIRTVCITVPVLLRGFIARAHEKVQLTVCYLLGGAAVLVLSILLILCMTEVLSGTALLLH